MVFSIRQYSAESKPWDKGGPVIQTLDRGRRGVVSKKFFFSSSGLIILV